MRSLNYAVLTGLGLLQLKPIDYVLATRLLDRFEEVALQQIRNGLSELGNEVNHHGHCTKAKVSTEKGYNEERVILAWDGPALADDLVQRINDSYRIGAESMHLPFRHGTQIAGFWFGFVNARIIIENYQDGDYRVRNIVHFPLG